MTWGRAARRSSKSTSLGTHRPASVVARANTNPMGTWPARTLEGLLEPWAALVASSAVWSPYGAVLGAIWGRLVPTLAVWELSGLWGSGPRGSGGASPGWRGPQEHPLRPSYTAPPQRRLKMHQNVQARQNETRQYDTCPNRHAKAISKAVGGAISEAFHVFLAQFARVAIKLD